jgi:tuftelin-interacting protein 11
MKKVTDSDELGSWEKHTKGIGSKLLQKFGFTGRLGAKESGIDKAIEVTVRPVNVGLGFGPHETEKKQRDYSTTPRSSMKRKKQMQPITKKQKKVRVVSDNDNLFSQLLETDLQDSRSTVRSSFADSDDDGIESESDLDSVDGEFSGRDLVGMASLLKFDSASVLGGSVFTETALIARIVTGKENRLRQMKAAVSQLSEKHTSDIQKVKVLKIICSTVTQMVDMISEGCSFLSLETNSVEGGIDLDAFKEKMQSLFEYYPQEFVLFGLSDLMHSVFQALVLSIFSSTREQNVAFFSLRGSSRFKQAFLEISRFISVFPIALVKEIERVILPATLERLLLPKFVAAIVNDFNPVDHTLVLVDYLQLLKPYVSAEKVREVLQVSLFPKMLTFVQKWSYSFRSNQCSIGPFQSVSLSGSDVFYIQGSGASFLFHHWILPILPDVDVHQIATQLFPEIRKKIIEVLRQLNFADSDCRQDSSDYECHERIRVHLQLIVDLISPWKDIFDRNSYSSVMVNYLIPKILVYAKSCSFICNSEDALVPYNNLLLLCSVLPSQYYNLTFILFFFPQFVSELFRRLHCCLDDCSSEEILQKLQRLFDWYMYWRRLLPSRLFLSSEKGFRAVALAKYCVVLLESCLSRCLIHIATMDRSTIDSFLPTIRLDWNNCIELVSSLTLNNMVLYLEGEQPTRTLRPSSIEIQSDVSLKELVQKVAERHGVQFSMLSRPSEDKMVYKFGNESIYFEGNIIYQHNPALKRWIPISFDELVLICVFP